MKKLSPPVDNFSFKALTSQLFGFNRFLYRQYGLPGHNGIDIKAPYGAPVYAAHDGFVRSVTVDDPTRTKGNGLYLASPDNSFETAYWHLSKFNGVYPGMQVKAGDVIGFVGNTGFVLPKPTPENPYAGTHLHFAVKVPYATAYDGFIDPAPWLFTSGDKFNYKLVTNFGMPSTHDDASFLHTLLMIEGISLAYNPHGTFGPKTRADVQKYQAKNGILQTGFVGPATRLAINRKYSSFF